MVQSRLLPIPVGYWDISRLSERRHSKAIPDDVIEGVAMCLGRGLDCYVPTTECEEAVELLFWALVENGWKVSPPVSGLQSSETENNQPRTRRTPPVQSAEAP